MIIERRTNMKINNVDKLREEVFNALMDNFTDDLDTPSCIWKDGSIYHESFEQRVTASFNKETQKNMIVSLPQPLMFRERKMALVIDESGADLYDTSIKEEYRLIDWEGAGEYRNRMSFMVAVTRMIDRNRK